MAHAWILAAAALAVGAPLTTPIPAYSQSGGEHGAASILNRLPPEMLMKVQALAQLLHQSIQEGTLTDAEIQQGMLSGRLPDKLKQISPDADQLFQEISTAIKEGKGPGQESILPLLQGLGGQPD